jgi:hypothetical protein
VEKCTQGDETTPEMDDSDGPDERDLHVHMELFRRRAAASHMPSLPYTLVWTARKYRSKGMKNGQLLFNSTLFPPSTQEHVRLRSVVLQLERQFALSPRILSRPPDCTAVLASSGLLEELDVRDGHLPYWLYAGINRLRCGLSHIVPDCSKLEYLVYVHVFSDGTAASAKHYDHYRVTAIDAAARDRRLACQRAAIILISLKGSTCIPWRGIRTIVARFVWDTRRHEQWNEAIYDDDDPPLVPDHYRGQFGSATKHHKSE